MNRLVAYMGDKDIRQKAEESVAEKLLLSFNDQFTTNQNHHQAIFLQFLSAILAVLIGYGFIYANTRSTSNMIDIRFDAKDKITIYAVFHLAGVYTISQFILTLLATVVLNIGYAFRRDQHVIHKIRIKYLGQQNYDEIFGKVTFRPHNQSYYILYIIPLIWNTWLYCNYYKKYYWVMNNKFVR